MQETLMDPARRRDADGGAPLDVAIIGCGYIGTALVERLRAGAPQGGSADLPPGRRRIGDLVATTTTASRLAALRAAGARPRVVRLDEPRALHGAVAGARAVYLLVAAGRGGDYRAVYLEGARALVRSVSGTGVRRIIYTSSCAVYGQRDGSWVEEDSAVEPVTERGRILLEAEETLLRGAADLGVRATVLRLAGIHGPDRGPQRRLEAVAGAERADGDAYLNLVHRDDVVTALVRLLEVPYHGVLNLSDDAPTRRRDYYGPRLAAAGLAPVRWRSADPAAPDQGRRVANARIKRVLGLTLAHPSSH
jgi:nucleoside-diphosphate-sugar epimerase